MKECVTVKYVNIGDASTEPLGGGSHTFAFESSDKASNVG